MRAAEGAAHEAGGRHVSGAERLVEAEDLESTAAGLLQRAVSAGMSPDFIRITVERIPREQVRQVSCLPVRTVPSEDAATAWELAVVILRRAGIASTAAESAYRGLRAGWVEGRPIRGAALLDARTGARLDPQPERGVRATRMDFEPEAHRELATVLAASGLAHFRTREALAVATKAIASGVLAEICWSDDPDYPAGYVATSQDGYMRFPFFKPDGAVGGRAFFLLPDADVAAIIESLEHESLWITGPFRVTNAGPPVNRLPDIGPLES